MRTLWQPSFDDALTELGGTSEFGIFAVLSGIPAFFLALTYGIGGATRVGRAVAQSGEAAVVLARTIFGLGGFALGAIVFYCTVRGGANLLLGTSDPYPEGGGLEPMSPGVAVWVALGAVVVVQVTAQIWLSAKPPKQAATA
ncbi:hypothetical protein ALI144C_15375 [Actinosynnema sp. ALI-1.44]|uniref:hypothetical protein n=1 Tax=Actinosynnema sp. ALI-1.44 TaxID=1933779 RepID=UPI00097CB5A3|nr:hypothetical protein [Actinosynnema sp. ALI-1.44]ONI84084.1 hypothetical protein ALI144C_15375 [Actinosynnema sp. ALI-1.44]